MSTLIPDITRIPAPRTPLIDERTGLMSREWYRFFYNLYNLSGSGGNFTSLLDLQKGPPSVPFEALQVDPNAPTNAPTDSPLVSQIDEIDKQLNALESQPECPCEEQYDELQKHIQGLQVTPPPREFKRARYGSFYDTTTQTVTTINTAKAITFNTTDLSRGVYIGTTTSRVYVDTEGIYNYQLSLQLDKTSGGAAEFYLWFRLNGTDVANSASQIRIQGNDAEIFVALNYFFNLAAGDYVEIMFSSTSLDVQLLAVAAAPPVPAIPSIILTVSNNIQGVQ